MADDVAHAKALRNRQNRLEDLQVFGMAVGSATDYTRVINDTTAYYKDVEPTRVEGVPVTTPKKEEPQPGTRRPVTRRAVIDTHHIVQLNNPKAGNDPDDVVAVQMLFRDYDGYYTAFRPIKRSHCKEDPSGWFYFNDVELPHFLMFDLRGKMNAYQLPFGSGYERKNTQVGHESVEAMFKSYSEYTKDNYKPKSETQDRRS